DKAGGPGQGSTSSSSSIIRFNYSTYAGVVLAWESFQTWLDWRAHLGAAPAEQIAEMVNLGVVMLDVPVMNMAATTELFNKVGIEYEIWDARTLAVRIPGIDPGKFWPPKPIDDPAFWEDATESTGALYTPAGGYISDPSLSAVNLADAAKRHGANFRFKEEIVSVIKSIDRVTGVGPMIGDLDVGVYMRPTPGGGFLVGGTEPECEPMQWIDDPDQAHMLRTQELYDAQVTRAARRFPDLKVPPVAKGIAGVYDVSSDWTPIYDKSELPGFYLAIGTSGNQFKNAPGVGVLMAKLIDYVEGGGDHEVTGVRTGLPIDLATFSRKRPRNENSSGTVMG
ncbi:MAG: FAD-binding oxidoreductase, partial [Actinobacteria bacterium]|nr:FAD-binding oxidoreductase [Actinomycetota bacterium]